ncbi:MAG: AbrB/MazE/SpoVT family DNA-binding domain-containing protein [Terriglobales bacterium]
MATAKLTTRGRVTIPAKIRSAMGLKPGNRVQFVYAGQGRFCLIVLKRTAEPSVRRADG